MKKKRMITCLLSAMLILSVGLMTGCDKVEQFANNAEKTVTDLESKALGLEDKVEGKVSGISDKLDNSALPKDASTLNDALKSFYAGVVAGMINENETGYLITETLPAKNASASVRKSAANALTLYSVLEWQGMTARYPEDVLAKLTVSGGNVVVRSENAGGITLHQTTTLGEILG